MSDLIDIYGVARRFSVSRSTIYRMIKEGVFTRAIHASARSARWPLEEVTAILDARICGKTTAQIKHLVQILTKQRRAKDNSPIAP